MLEKFKGDDTPSDGKKGKVVYKKPLDIKVNAKKMDLSVADIVRLKDGNDTLFIPRSTYDKRNLSVDNLSEGFDKKDLDEFLRENMTFNPNDKYKIYMLTDNGWMSGKSYFGKNLEGFCNFSNVLNSDQNWVDKSDDIVYAINVYKYP
jgi:hypothetical protein